MFLCEFKQIKHGLKRDDVIINCTHVVALCHAPSQFGILEKPIDASTICIKATD